MDGGVEPPQQDEGSYLRIPKHIKLMMVILALLTMQEAGSAGLATHLGRKEARDFANGAALTG